MTAGAERWNDGGGRKREWRGKRTGITAGAEVWNGGVERTGMTGKIDGDGDGAIIVRFNPMPVRPNH